MTRTSTDTGRLPPTGRNSPFLQHPQELHLEGGRGLADLVQEQGAAVGLLEQADAVLEGAGEGAPLVAEQFRLQQVVRQGAAVLHHEGLVGAAAGVVDGPGQEFLAGAGFAGEQDGHVEAGGPGHQVAHRVHRAAFGAHHVVHGRRPA
jgi:hypothetical protein